jgi:hypothetical protein
VSNKVLEAMATTQVNVHLVVPCKALTSSRGVSLHSDIPVYGMKRPLPVTTTGGDPSTLVDRHRGFIASLLAGELNPQPKTRRK